MSNLSAPAPQEPLQSSESSGPSSPSPRHSCWGGTALSVILCLCVLIALLKDKLTAIETPWFVIPGWVPAVLGWMWMGSPTDFRRLVSPLWELIPFKRK